MPVRSLRSLVGLAARVVALAPIPCAGACLNVSETTAEPGAGAPTTAAEVLTRYVSALGGEKKLRAVGQRTVEARVTFLPEAGCTDPSTGCVAEETTGQFTLQNTADGRMFRRMVVGSTVAERGYDGKVGWELQGEPRVLVLDDEATAVASREDALLHWYLDYAAREIVPAIESPRTEDSDGKRRDLDGVRWVAQDDQLAPRLYWFERKTGLLAEEVEQEPGRELRRTVIYEDYRPVDGVLVPHKIRQISEAGKARQEVEIAVQRVHHEPVRREAFAVPTLPAPPPSPDEVLAALDGVRKAAGAAPRDPALAFQWASTAWVAGHFDEAARAAKTALSLSPRDPAALFILGRAQLLTGDLRAAQRTLEQARSAGAHPQRVAHHLATVQLHRKDFGGAAASFQAAGEAALAARYEAFSGKPLQARWAGDGCRTALPLVGDLPVAVVEARLEGEPVRLLLDTSAADLVIDADRARKLVIGTDSESSLSGPEGPRIAHGQADTLVLGDLTVQRVPVDIFPAGSLASMAGDAPVDGMLGVRSLLDAQVTIDRPAGHVVLVRNAGRCRAALAGERKGSPVPFSLYETHMVYVTGFLNGAEGLYLLNTGMRGAALTANQDAFARAGVGSPTLRRGDAGALVSIASFRLHGGPEITQTNAAWGVLDANATRDEFRFDGMFGLDAIGAGRLTIDFAQRRLYIGEAPAPDPARPASAG